MKTWTFHDKTKWPLRGEWDSEPDKVQWTDEATGLVCLALRNMGNWCGYVAVTESHPAFKQEYDALDVEVHGGLTFAGFCMDGEDEDRICHVPEPGQPDKVWWLGFDCAHAWDYRPPMNAKAAEFELRFHLPGDDRVYRNLEYVKSECTSLAHQLANALSGKPLGL